MIVKNAVFMTHYLLLEKIKQAECVADATAGRGYDTLFLAEHTPKTAEIWSFDIQSIALDSTRQLLKNRGIERPIHYIQASHQFLTQHIQKPLQAVIFNLGYLPGGDHNLVTRAEVTLESVAAILPYLQVGGIIAITAYPGHPEGRRECTALKEYLSTLGQKEYEVACWQMLNQINFPPKLFLIEKRMELNYENSAACKN